MPTKRPRYQVTDTGAVRVVIDRAALAWPEIADDRKRLLVRLVELGAQHLPATEETSLERVLAEHVGRWVAVGDGRLLIAADDVRDVVGWLRREGVRAGSVFRVPATDVEITGEHGVA